MQLQRKKRKSTLTTSREERRRRLSKWIDPKFIYTSQGKIPPSYPESWKADENWKYEKICHTCQSIYGVAYLKADNNWYCSNCARDIEGPSLKEHIASQSDSKDLIKHVEWHLLKWRIKELLKCLKLHWNMKI